MGMSIINDLYKSIDRGRRGTNIGLSTGLNRFDEITFGIQKGWMTLVGGDSGKSLKKNNNMLKLNKETSDKILELYKNKNSVSEIHNILKVGKTTIRRYLKLNGINLLNRNLHVINYNELINLYLNENLSLTKFCKKYHVSQKWFGIYLKKNNIITPNYHNETKFNENIFDIIDSEEKAYWLGFIYADGCVMDDNKFEISLKYEDIDHLNKFNKFMQHKYNNVKFGKTNYKNKLRCRWGVSNKHLKEQLIKLGCTPRKSLILKFPNENIFNDKNLIRHFIRGYFDGDGCISYQNKNHTKLCISIVGTIDFIKGIYKYFNLNVKIRKVKNVYVVSKNGIDSFKFIKYLYNNSNIYLDRKYSRYLKMCRLYENTEKIGQKR